MGKTSEILKNRYGLEYPFEPDRLAKKALAYMKPGGTLLDAGCREGADSFYYAKKGMAVTAVDGDEMYLKKFRALKKDLGLSNISIKCADLTTLSFPVNHYDAVSCLLVGCCMKKSDFEKMLIPLKRSLKTGGIVVMSLRNYRDPELAEYLATEKMIEPNTFCKKGDCCKIRYYIEKGRLRALFDGFKILYYYEGLVRDKYGEVEKHSDSNIICMKKG